MDPLLIISLIQAGVKAAPDVGKFLASTKDYITSLFAGGVIDAATQDKLHGYCDEVMNAVLAGDGLPHWQVESDPQ